ADAPFQPAEFALVLESLREPMRQLSSDRNRIDQTGRELEGIISQWLESLARRPITRSQASAILGHLLSQRGNLVSEGWDQAAHLYLSTVALRPNFRSPMRRGNLGDDDIFQELRDRLSWNRGESDHFAIFDSPRYVSGNAREEIVELFDQINARLSRQRDVPRSASENGSSDSNAGNWVQFTDPAQASF
ncbi:MAG: hypothetical protein KDA80_22110, partial [Planctomycetaceae bacterium]|nr:hypothetical protein [Planctomycetaceae bacterium]